MKKKAPSLITIERFYRDALRALINGEWVFVRSLGFYSFWHSLKLAWGVFIGKYDAFKWPGNQ